MHLIIAATVLPSKSCKTRHDLSLHVCAAKAARIASTRAAQSQGPQAPVKHLHADKHAQHSTAAAPQAAGWHLCSALAASPPACAHISQLQAIPPATTAALLTAERHQQWGAAQPAHTPHSILVHCMR
jgi:hypothetical protein